jgi:hypothetical protein
LGDVEFELPFVQLVSEVAIISNKHAHTLHPTFRRRRQNRTIDIANSATADNPCRFVQSEGGSESLPGVTSELAAVAIVIITGAEVTLEVSVSCPGLKLQVAGTGRPEQANVTTCGEPLTVTVIGAEVCPDTTDNLLGDGALKVKLCVSFFLGCVIAGDRPEAKPESTGGKPGTLWNVPLPFPISAKARLGK